MNEWISIKDRLPKESGTYLVVLYQEDKEDGFVLEAWYNNIPPIFQTDDSIGWHLLNEFYDLTKELVGYITHWMPLPEIPQKEKDE